MGLVDDIVARWKTAQATMTLDANATTGARYTVTNGTWPATAIVRLFYQAVETLRTQALLDGILQAAGLTTAGGLAEWLSAMVSGGQKKFRIVVADGQTYLTWNARWSGTQWLPDTIGTASWLMLFSGAAGSSAGLLSVYGQQAATSPIAFDAWTNGHAPAASYVVRSPMLCTAGGNVAANVFANMPATNTWTVSVPVTKTYALWVKTGFFFTVAAGTARYQIIVDNGQPGVQTLQDAAMEQSKNTLSDHTPFTFHQVVTLTAGSHTLLLQWAASAGTLNMNASDTASILLVG